MTEDKYKYPAGTRIRILVGTIPTNHRGKFGYVAEYRKDYGMYACQIDGFKSVMLFKHSEIDEVSK